ncbi:phenylalanine-tRNA ligase, alpha subunit [Vittaforma corneae ATCC 50505]|uniref:Probable phenylalanine--tRNA ligase alpha subunit n=1 Tax=Vittaforma corneae (strain ATCC 50505) TaxID=993615 RepID=L2GL15_VITCO|nr:phenylalanine-tRNA ligase, alpha subunit [Vittaforma corneae ATCC 50505]ELA41573.1 phenylalanine-tRNA ligase, alpha subunit [Vittaforma corneae ATCC 50505]
MEDCNAKRILRMLEENEFITSEDLEIPANDLHGLLLSLESKGQVVFEISEKHARVLTSEGKGVLKNGTQEFNLFREISEDGTDSSILQKYPLGSNYAFRNRWIKMENNRIYKCKKNVEDDVAKLLKSLTVLTDREFSDLKKRKLVDQSKSNVYIIKKGPRFGEINDYLTELTSEIVVNYRGEVFKKYNFDSIGNIPSCGSFHPLMKIREEFKRIFLEMGFNEMNTSRYVESSFWNFDSLFQPQDHPSRDAHDTFFIRNPELTTKFDDAYFERVRSMHSSGGYGSIGYQCEWNPKEAMKNILRTHTTAISSRYLQSMVSKFRPIKLFSIDKVFRNESVDATHLAEFHQVEGLIAGYGLGLRELMGMLKAFFEKLGLRNIKFKPAFNPYTEPSMEVFGYHEGLRRWIEIGNSGVFRPEMLRPMGYDENVSVIAWGLSLERPAMIKYGLNNIRDLVGHRVDINFIKKSEFIYF